MIRFSFHDIEKSSLISHTVIGIRAFSFLAGNYAHPRSDCDGVAFVCAWRVDSCFWWHAPGAFGLVLRGVVNLGTCTIAVNHISIRCFVKLMQRFC